MNRDYNHRTTDEREVLKHFRVIVGAMKEHFNTTEKIAGISGSQLWALSLIKNSQGMKVNEIAEAMAIHQSTASNLLDKLEEKKLIRRERASTDQRVVQLYITETGSTLMQGVTYPPEGIIPYVIHQLSDNHLDQLKQSLSAFVEIMTIKDERSSMTPLSDI